MIETLHRKKMPSRYRVLEVQLRAKTYEDGTEVFLSTFKNNARFWIRCLSRWVTQSSNQLHSIDRYRQYLTCDGTFSLSIAVLH